MNVNTEEKMFFPTRVFIIVLQARQMKIKYINPSFKTFEIVSEVKILQI